MMPFLVRRFHPCGDLARVLQGCLERDRTPTSRPSTSSITMARSSIPYTCGDVWMV